MPTYCLNNIHGAVRIISLDWYKGGNNYGIRMLPSLAVCYDVGRCQLMTNHEDPDPVLLNTGIQITCSCWNEDGSMLAVAGTQMSTDRNINVVQFYNPFGHHLSTLLLPGKCLTACTWEGNASLRLALAVDSFLYFANLRPHYKWAYSSTANTIIYNYSRPHTFEHSITFWNLKTNKTKIISVHHLIDICASEDYVCLVCKPSDAGQGVILTMYTAIGVAIESKHVQFEPTQSMMTSNQIILINKSFIYSWQYFTPKQILDLGFKFTSSTLRQRDGIERLYHIDTISLKTVSSDLVDDDISSSIFQTKVDWNLMNQPVSSDPISTLTISHSTRRLLIARESGLIQIYRLPDLYYEMKFSDNPDIFAIMEKTRMYIFDGLQSEPAIHTSTYLYEFKNLEVQGILLDELVKTVNIQPNEEFLLKTPIKAEILVYFKKYDEAETLLLNNDRSDLAVELRKRLGDWFRVAQLTKDTGVLMKDLEQAEIWNGIVFALIYVHFKCQLSSTSQFYIKYLLRDKAAGYYQQGNDLLKFAECLYQLEDYKGIERIIEELPDCHDTLYDFGLRFANLGMIKQAMYAFIKCNRRKEAIDVCLRLNEWRVAYELAKSIDSQDTDHHHHQEQQKRIDNLLKQSVNCFIEQGKIIEAVELYKHAGRFLDAAELLYKEVQKIKQFCNRKPLYMKKMYVLIGLLMEQYYEQNKTQANVKPRNPACGECLRVT
ncbi:WD repeat-containing protein 35 [Schistosoma bovis]|uniref:WD repeat-containing protein 35 n=1 Tax=Schistosoma bovis TaxID=6184 RepID=A0A430Q540_SCHBO|nr:WD repeat-containing protein 35 [Schistosoma bovis]